MENTKPWIRWVWIGLCAIIATLLIVIVGYRFLSHYCDGEAE